ncbi:MAG: arginine repressor [Oscillospiraceae bacterium]|jgi:transcriptional regulator of arginine metabolism|nr:arginine repressor [Oscillospiraceae bacterium]
MKAKRHAKIIDIIKSQKINTQEELQYHLKKAGFDVTQATISRDIKELRLIKTLGSDGYYRYATADRSNDSISSKFNTLFSDTVVNIDYAGNIVVIKCLSGTATAACAAIDALHRPNIVGTISGDDTFLCIMRNEENAVDLVLELKKLIYDTKA